MAGGATGSAVRLRVAYKSPEALLGELTKSVGRGGVRIESKRSLAIGTKFVFEMRSVGVAAPVELSGTVTSVTESAPGRFVLHIRYEPPHNRQGLDAVIARIFDTSRADVKRKHPRIPLHVRAVEDKPNSPVFRLRDISRGGVGVDVEGDKLPSHIKVGVPFLLQMKLSTGQLAVHGEVAWCVSSRDQAVPPRLGVMFGQLAPHMAQLLEDLLSLKALPSPPWIAKLVFGDEAVARMANAKR